MTLLWPSAAMQLVSFAGQARAGNMKNDCGEKYLRELEPGQFCTCLNIFDLVMPNGHNYPLTWR